MTGQREQGNRAVWVAAVTDWGHVSVPHDWHGSQRLAGGVWVLHGVTRTRRGGQLGAQRQVLLHRLVLALVEMELGVLQVALHLKKRRPLLQHRDKWSGDKKADEDVDNCTLLLVC